MRKIILVLLLPVFVFADYMISVPTPEEVSSMHAILEAIAMIFQSSDYVDMLRLMVLFGTVVSVFEWAAGTIRAGHDGGFNFTKYHLGVVAILSLVFSHSSTVWVKSQSFPSYYDTNATSTTTTTGVAVANIPTVVGYGLSFLNTFGSKSVELMETAMSPIGTYSVIDGGYASHMRDNIALLSLDFGETNANLASSVQNLMAQCVFIPFSSKGDDGGDRIQELLKSNNITETFDNWYSGGVVVGGIPAGSYTAEVKGQTYTCSGLWTKIKTTNMPAFNADVGQVLADLDTRDIQMITTDPSIPKSHFDQIAIQAGMINSIVNNKTLPTGIAYAAGKERAEFIQKNVATGYYMSEMLPIMQSIFRALVYALLPIMIAISLFPKMSSVLKNYAKAAIWIELWGVSAAILNFFITKYVEVQVAGDLTVYSSAKMLSESASMAGMAGYLYLMVPGISWGIMTGSFHMLGGLARGVGASMGSQVQTQAFAQAEGKMQLMNTMSQEQGQSVNLAEAIGQREIQANQAAAIQASENFKQGITFMDKERYGARSSYDQLQGKQNAMAEQGKGTSPYSVSAQEGKDTERSFSQTSTKTDNTTNADSRGAGEFDAANQKANADMSQKFGVNGLADTKFDKANEQHVRDQERYDMLRNDMGMSNEFLDKYYETSTNQDIRTQEMPAHLRNDINGDGKISDQEIQRQQDSNMTQQKIGVNDQIAKQDQLRQSGADNKQSRNQDVSNSQNIWEKVVEGSPDAAVIAASATKAAMGEEIGNFNMRKDSQTIDNLQKQGIGAEDVAINDTKQQSGAFYKNNTEAQTLSQEFTSMVQNHDMNSYEVSRLANFGLADEDVTKTALNSEISQIKSDTDRQIQQELNQQFSGREIGQFRNHEHFSKLQEQARNEGDTPRVEALQKSIDRIENSTDMKAAVEKANDFLSSERVQDIRAEGQEKIYDVYELYEKMGAISVGSDGSISYRDTEQDLKSAGSSEELIEKTNQIKSSLDGLKASYVDLDGKERTVVKNLEGENVTDITKATQEWSQAGNFNNDAKFHISKGDYVDKKTIATVSTGINSAKEVVSLFGAGKAMTGKK